MRKILAAGALFGVLALPGNGWAQDGAVSGAAAGAVGGAVVGGPVGAVIGGAGGFIVGGISEANRPRFREHVVRESRPSVEYREEVRVGARLPSTVTYYDVPADYGVTKYKYTVVNKRPVLVDPGTREIVEIID